MEKILITGSNSGVGKVFVKKFSSEGYDVFAHYGKKNYDFRNEQEVKELAERAIDYGVTIIINNAGMLCPNITLEQYTSKLINDIIDVNLRAPILLTYYMLSQLTNVINMNSMVSLSTKKPRTLYSATKSGLRGFSNSLRLESKDIKILDVYPTNIRTTSDKKDAMDVEMVVDQIYDAFKNEVEELILNGITNKRIKCMPL